MVAKCCSYSIFLMRLSMTFQPFVAAAFAIAITAGAPPVFAHGDDRPAAVAGGAELPRPVRALMKLTAKVMTRTAYWI